MQKGCSGRRNSPFSLMSGKRGRPLRVCIAPTHVRRGLSGKVRAEDHKNVTRRFGFLPQSVPGVGCAGIPLRGRGFFCLHCERIIKWKKVFIFQVGLCWGVCHDQSNKVLFGDCGLGKRNRRAWCVGFFVQAAGPVLGFRGAGRCLSSVFETANAGPDRERLKGMLCVAMGCGRVWSNKSKATGRTHNVCRTALIHRCSVSPIILI